MYAVILCTASVKELVMACAANADQTDAVIQMEVRCQMVQQCWWKTHAAQELLARDEARGGELPLRKQRELETMFPCKYGDHVQPPPTLNLLHLRALVLAILAMYSWPCPTSIAHVQCAI